MSWLRQSGKKSPLLLKGRSAFSLIQAFSGLDGAHPHQGRQSSLLSLWIQMVISSRNTFKDASRLVFDQVSGHPTHQSN